MEENGGKTFGFSMFVSATIVFPREIRFSTLAQLKVRVQPPPVVGDDVDIHLVVVLGILGQVADGFAVRLLVAVDPVEPDLLVLHLLLQQGGLQGVVCVRY